MVNTIWLASFKFRVVRKEENTTWHEAVPPSLVLTWCDMFVYILSVRLALVTWHCWLSLIGTTLLTADVSQEVLLFGLFFKMC